MDTQLKSSTLNRLCRCTPGVYTKQSGCSKFFWFFELNQRLQIFGPLRCIFRSKGQREIFRLLDRCGPSVRRYCRSPTSPNTAGEVYLVREDQPVCAVVGPHVEVSDVAVASRTPVDAILGSE